MRMSQFFFNTIRETKEDDTISNQLLTRSGMIRKNSAGVYSFMPLGYKVIQNIQKIIREEMDDKGGNELLMPALIMEEVYEKSGRTEAFGNSVFRVKDRANKNYILGPTHEEVFTEAVKENIKSYKTLPTTLYQFQNKFRDEARPRYGLIRVKEFIMKDAYSFDKDYDGLEISYNKMYDAYCRIFERLGIEYVVVKADTGVMGGLLSEEFMALAKVGEDKLIICNNCDYAANREVAECKDIGIENNDGLKTKEELYTPNVGKIEDITKEYRYDKKTMTKSLIYKADKEFILVMVRSDREVNEVKLQKTLGVKNLELAETPDVIKLTGAGVGFAGPIGLKMKVVADNEIKYMKNFLVGANKTDYHYINVNFDRDFNIDIFADIRNIIEEDVCPVCGEKINFKNGIEVGNTFKLGTKYTETLGCLFVDEDNTQKPMVMGCYGIGVARCMATIVEQSNDENGIIWPYQVAPYKVIIVPINVEDEKQMGIAERLYKELKANDIEVILDDRKERPGVKFKDADLIGIPIRITVGKKAEEGIIEYKLRVEKEVLEISIEDALTKVKKLKENNK